MYDHANIAHLAFLSHHLYTQRVRFSTVALNEQKLKYNTLDIAYYT